ncbi:hypothetical protein ARMGADRAFT_1006332 [Armillaria gallica]|uniref:Uncharacterized protein n=1 Tax=Armillaria gallica TaxID=47427 RepID=A0A2H3E6F8_ARMGA|nr:hypothetical protein ARMGADRAFT_1006332 [Armillaria gallica]
MGLAPTTDWLACCSYLLPSLYLHNLFIMYLSLEIFRSVPVYTPPLSLYTAASEGNK